MPGRLGVAVFYNRVAPARLEGGADPLAGALPDGSRVITVDKQLVSDDASGGGAGFAFDELASFTLKNYNTHESSAWVYAFRRTDGAAEGGRNLS